MWGHTHFPATIINHSTHNKLMQYYISNNGQQAGPFEVQDLIANGLNQSSLVWCEGMANWLPATQVPEVAQLFTQAPPQPQAPQPQPQAPQPQYQQPVQQSMGFGESIKVCFSKYADFEGRASPAEFWWFFLFQFILGTVTCGIGNIATIIPSYAVGARRLHDTGRSGWLQLLSLVPLVGLILIYWFAISGDQGDNMYGPKPLK